LQDRQAAQDIKDQLAQLAIREQQVQLGFQGIPAPPVLPVQLA
jgi:hypothetical protein